MSDMAMESESGTVSVDELQLLHEAKLKEATVIRMPHRAVGRGLVLKICMDHYILFKTKRKETKHCFTTFKKVYYNAADGESGKYGCSTCENK